MKKRYSNGFTLTELLVTIAIFLLITGAVYSGFLLSQRAYRASELASELSQNGRVVLERITREIRQAKEIATELAEEEPAETVSPADGIIFEDGHGTTTYYYIHYYKEDSSLNREILGYYFSGNPGVYVPWNAVPPGGQTLETEILESPKTVGEYITGIKFWGTKVVSISLVLEKKQKTVELSTKIFGRNL
ncbi:MAG: prepilin-type N-terminal cleavage/methylation domain-containing protein [bacterium]|nr:prepilin-type N-terminal cleavage/methylation domain-containing protein [bacterium]